MTTHHDLLDINKRDLSTNDSTSFIAHINLYTIFHKRQMGRRDYEAVIFVEPQVVVQKPIWNPLLQHGKRIFRQAYRDRKMVNFLN